MLPVCGRLRSKSSFQLYIYRTRERLGQSLIEKLPKPPKWAVSFGAHNVVNRYLHLVFIVIQEHIPCYSEGVLRELRTSLIH